MNCAKKEKNSIKIRRKIKLKIIKIKKDAQNLDELIVNGEKRQVSGRWMRSPLVNERIADGRAGGDFLIEHSLSVQVYLYMYRVRVRWCVPGYRTHVDS